MHQSVAVDERLEAVDVCGQKLLEVAAFQHVGDDGILPRQLFQHLRARRIRPLFILFGSGQTQLFKQDLAKLRRRVQVEGLARLLVDPGSDLGDLFAVALFELRAGGAVDAHPAHFHIVQHVAEGQFQVLIQ